MEKQERKVWVEVVGERNGIERKMERLMFIDNLLCISDYERLQDYDYVIMRSTVYLFMLFNLIFIPTLWDNDCFHYFKDEEYELNFSPKAILLVYRVAELEIQTSFGQL